MKNKEITCDSSNIINQAGEYTLVRTYIVDVGSG